MSALPRPLQNAVENNRELFDIGLHGPDILFYYRPVVKNPVSGQGYELHDKMADEFFENASQVIRNAENPAAARAYIYGFICHFALDSECHNYIEKMIQVSGISHSEIERHIRPTIENARVIAPFFQDLTPETVKKALSSMIFYHKLLLAPNPGKRKVLFGGMKVAGLYSSMKGMVMSLEPNPACRDYCLLLKNRFAGAVPLAASLIIQYQKKLFQGGELPKRFHQTFGAGDSWESLHL